MPKNKRTTKTRSTKRAAAPHHSRQSHRPRNGGKAHPEAHQATRQAAQQLARAQARAAGRGTEAGQELTRTAINQTRQGADASLQVAEQAARQGEQIWRGWMSFWDPGHYSRLAESWLDTTVEMMEATRSLFPSSARQRHGR